MASSSTSYYNYSGSQRPNTANSVIEMLAIEKAHDGSGLTLCSGGVFVASQCHVILFVMSGIFTAVGVVVSAISYRPRDFGEDFQKYLARQVCSTISTTYLTPCRLINPGLFFTLLW